MSSLPRLFERWNRSRASMGVLTLSALAVAVATGIVLAAGFDVAHAAESVALLELSSPTGRAVRALHAWSSHLLIVLALLHVVEHLANGGIRKLGSGVWLRVVLSIPLVLLLALGGFMLKGDAEGELARQILTGLLERVPLVGKAVSAALLGTGDDLQVVYVHHAGTLTIVVMLVAIEHARRLWPTRGGLLAISGVALALAWLAPPAMHDGIDPVVKGPWYFVALQEILHWLSRPSWIWLPVLFFLLALWSLPRLKEAGYRRVCRTLAVMLAAYAALGIFAALFRGAGWELALPWPSSSHSSRSTPARFAPLSLARLDESRLPRVQGRPEGCVGCHVEVTGLSVSHSPEALGCFSCHLGDPLAPDAARAHRGMVLVPGNLDTATLTCGRAGCHDSVVPRVKGSLMATVRGMISVDRWAFGEQATQDGTDSVAQLRDSPADTHLRQLCVGCHLGQLKEKPGPSTEASRGGGCAACHLTYPEKRDYSKDHAARFVHPNVSIKVADDNCFGCHSRSGRISLSYSGWWESGVSEGETRKLEDGRILRKTTDDAHHAKGMACVDCHTAQEAMGSGGGEVPLHEEGATRVRCETCHRTSAVRTVALSELSPEARAIVRLRFGESAPPRFVVEDATGEALTNAVPLADGSIEIRGKLSGVRLVAKPPSPNCTGISGHARLSCRSCHETWVTQCVACHTQWDAKGTRRDALTGEEYRGAWVEYDAPPRIGPPALGLLERAGRSEIVPFAPGMVMTLNGPTTPASTPLPSAAKELISPRSRFLRAYAPAVPHTTTRQGLSCVACHNDPQVLGFGRGKLTPRAGGDRPSSNFESAYETSTFDRRPADAWIGALDRSVGVSTRKSARSLTVEEQRRVLTVGACLPCHEPAKSAELYRHFDESLKKMLPQCRPPQ